MKIEKEKGTSYLVIKSSFYCFFDILTFRDQSLFVNKYVVFNINT